MLFYNKLSLCCVFTIGKGEGTMKDQNYFLEKAAQNMPKLHLRALRPQLQKIDLVKGDSFVLDLGEHGVGYFSFQLDNVDVFIDAPVRLIIKFGEDMREIEDDFSAYQGKLSKVWLQQEVLVLDYPQTVRMPRRYSCRYIKITVDDITKPITLFDFCFTAATSADIQALQPAKTTDPLLEQIDRVSATTLQECMQTFFEDGPKRDRRLWIGDLRLEALTNYYTFRNSETVKRSLYLIAAGKCNKLGFVPSYIYETPYYSSGRDSITDYALLYVVSVCDYYTHTGDRETLLDLLDLCKAQLDSYERILDGNGIVIPQDGWFSFIDWCPGLRGLTALQGVYLYALAHFIPVLEELNDGDAEKYRNLLNRIRIASRKHLFDEEKGLFINALDGEQLSVHAQVWMILGGVIDGKEAEYALQTALADQAAHHPFTPYMWHYVIEAMFQLGLKEDAVALIKRFWGGMLARGADTFFEVYVPHDPDFSPYGDRMVNSLCHAWSCTPSYFIRKYSL